MRKTFPFRFGIPACILTLCCLSLVWSGSFAAEAQDKQGKEQETQGPKEDAAAKPVVLLKTSEGSLKIELWPDKAPVTVKNFLRYAGEGFYDGTIFHRVIPGFVIQGGGFSPDMKQKKTHDPIRNEASAEVKNLRGTICMARTNVVDSATSQFFINLRDNASLDHVDDSPQRFGYAVFGKVVDGMDIVDRIAKVQTTTVGAYDNVPLKPIVIESAKQVGK
ncbi:MAG: peptidylprolyl isomerase [Syntrophobacteraceae bacterium]